MLRNINKIEEDRLFALRGLTPEAEDLINNTAFEMLYETFGIKSAEEINEMVYADKLQELDDEIIWQYGNVRELEYELATRFSPGKNESILDAINECYVTILELEKQKWDLLKKDTREATEGKYEENELF